jgi:hypothetical protein
MVRREVKRAAKGTSNNSAMKWQKFLTEILQFIS